MRILNVIATMDPKSGGPCQGLRNSIPVQKKGGIENEVVCFDEPDMKFSKYDDFKIHAIGPAKGPYAYCPRLKKWLYENMERFDITLIHGLWLYNSFGTYISWLHLKKKNKDVPKLYLMPHGMLDPYFQRARSRRLKAIRNWFFWKLIEKRVVNGADGLLFTCNKELNLAKETFSNYKPKSVLNTGFGIPEPPAKNINHLWTFLKKCPRISTNAYWLFLSRIHPKKGVDLLVKEYLKLKNENDEIPDLVIAGPGLETTYGKDVQMNGKHPSIHFPGMLEGKAKWSAFHFCEAFILPSHQENFGIAVVEALACKKPVLISDQINIWKEIEAGGGGLVSKDTSEGIRNLLKNWISLSARQQAEMGLNAYKVYRENFYVEKTALDMISKIESN